jgi:tRNA (adenine37-N6)-methyltransferase
MTTAPAELRFIGWIRTPYPDTAACPRQPWHQAADSVIEISPNYLETVDGLAVGMRLHVLWWAHRANRELRRRRPAEGAAPLGVLAGRGVDRPNPIGLTLTEGVRMEDAHVRDPGAVSPDVSEVVSNWPQDGSSRWAQTAQEPLSGALRSPQIRSGIDTFAALATRRGRAAGPMLGGVGHASGAVGCQWLSRSDGRSSAEGPGLGSTVQGVAFSPDGTQLATASALLRRCRDHLGTAVDTLARARPDSVITTTPLKATTPSPQPGPPATPRLCLCR